MVAQKERPLASVWNLRRLAQNLRNGVAIGLAQSHEDTGHKGKMKGHITFIFVTEKWPYVRWPLVRFGQKHTRFIVLVEKATQFFQYCVSLREILVNRPLTLA